MYVCVSERQGVIEKNEEREIMVYNLESGEDYRTALHLSIHKTASTTMLSIKSV